MVNDIPVIDLTSLRGGRGFARFIIKVKDCNGDIVDIDCYITEATASIEENLVPKFRLLDEATLIKNNRLFFRDPPSCDVHVEIHGEVKTIKGGYTDVFPKRSDSWAPN